MGVTPETGVTSLVAKQICFGSVKRATCTDFLQKVELPSSFSNNFSQPDLLQDRFDSRVVKRVTSLFHSFCSNVSKQVARFSCPFWAGHLCMFFELRVPFDGRPFTHSLKRSNVKQENGGDIWKKLLLFFLYFLSSGRSVCRWRYQQGSKKRLIGGTYLKWARIGKPVRARY